MNRIKLIISFLVLLLIGYGAGKIIGTNLISGMLLKESRASRASLLFYRPADQYVLMYMLINSDNELQRLTGYYSLLDNDMIDEEFLKERYNKERSTSIKRTIIWILSYAKNFNAVKDIYNDIYDNSNLVIQKEVLRSIKKRDSDYFKVFTDKHFVNKNLLDEL